MSKFTSLLWGLVLIMVGVILGCNATGLTNINIFFDGWWTLFIIVPCFIGLFNDNDKTGSIIGIVIGIFLLLCCQDVLNFEMFWKLLIPCILVVIGLSIVLKNAFGKNIADEIKKLNKSNHDDYCSTFSSQKVNIDEEFKGTKMSAIFGGIELDLRNAKIKEDVVINTSSIFGGIDLYVPENVNIKIKSTSIFGGVDDERKNRKNDSKYTIYINATCLFGGVDIK